MDGGLGASTSSPPAIQPGSGRRRRRRARHLSSRWCATRASSTRACGDPQDEFLEFRRMSRAARRDVPLIAAISLESTGAAGLVSRRGRSRCPPRVWQSACGRRRRVVEARPTRNDGSGSRCSRRSASSASWPTIWSLRCRRRSAISASRSSALAGLGIGGRSRSLVAAEHSRRSVQLPITLTAVVPRFAAGRRSRQWSSTSAKARGGCSVNGRTGSSSRTQPAREPQSATARANAVSCSRQRQWKRPGASPELIRSLIESPDVRSIAFACEDRRGVVRL
jgi:hypothetical protein